MERNDIPATLRGHRLVDLIELFLDKHFYDKDPFNNPHIKIGTIWQFRADTRFPSGFAVARVGTIENANISNCINISQICKFA